MASRLARPGWLGLKFPAADGQTGGVSIRGERDPPKNANCSLRELPNCGAALVREPDRPAVSMRAQRRPLVPWARLIGRDQEGRAVVDALLAGSN